MRLAAIILILGAVPCSILAADMFGYYEGQYFGFTLNDELSQVQSNKLRLDLEQYPSEKVKFGANINFVNHNGTMVFNVLDYLPPEVTAEVAPDDWDDYQFAYSDTIFLDNAFLRMSFNRFDITAGRQQISYGTGYAFNPTDVFNVKDALDPTYEQPGQNGIRFDVPISNRYGLTGVYSPGDDWDSTIKMLRLKGGLGHFDFSLTGAMLEWTENDYLNFEAVSTKRAMAGFDFAGELLGVGVWFEGAYNALEDGDDYNEIAAGLDYTFESGFYTMTEYYFNGLGKEDSEDYVFNDWMRYLAGELRSLGQHNLFIYGDYPVSDFMRLGSSVILSASDNSFALVPQLTYSIFQDVDLTVFGNIYGGETGGAFSEDSGTGGMARVRVYF